MITSENVGGTMWEKVFLEILQSSQENTFFIEYLPATASIFHGKVMLYLWDIHIFIF